MCLHKKNSRINKENWEHARIYGFIQMEMAKKEKKEIETL